MRDGLALSVFVVLLTIGIFTPQKYGSFSHILHCLLLHLTLRNIACILLMVPRFSLSSID
jgi:hypothetical protein